MPISEVGREGRQPYGMEVDVRRSLIGGVIALLCLLLMGAPNAQAGIEHIAGVIGYQQDHTRSPIPGRDCPGDCQA